ncbi:MAG: 30S ribosomal protein S9, partial [Acidimicrobium sp. BACL17 MAG-120924-bin0]
MGTKPLTQTTGRRKEAVARVRLRPGTGKVVINGREFEDYFPNALQRAAATEAFRVVEAETTYDVDCDIQGGGIAGQAGALRMAIARSILELDE